MFNDPSMSDQSGGSSFERNPSREPASLTSSRAMVIKPILAEKFSENDHADDKLACPGQGA
jgi:hypothetical protein